MSTTVFVVPTEAGAKLSHPVSGILPDGGADWLADQFTFRLIRDGAIAKSEPAPAKASSTSAKTDNS
ncbi:hypothetical protein [Rhizobium miluonense]|uniref:Uncharacterized protein n=1 Tax=Rhizobium miluonense TaxID=411945 RepID=A0A1C3WNZ6_9HYPH|nr:hypothetical protein [Rhizobium miluonense]SCB41783.1 hypothetical protein GA0061102_103516 [Rhizobium miluonense]